MKKIKIHKKYKRILSKKSRYFVCTGGRGSGKSFSITTLLCMLILEENRKILFLRKTLTSAHLSIIPEFTSKIELLGLEHIFEVTKTEIVNKLNGNVIYFRGIQTSSKDNTANLKSLEGISILVIDEAEELVDEEVFDRIDLSVRKKGVENKVILILNPSTKEHWIYKRFFIENGVDAGYNGYKNNVSYIHTTYLDNIKNLDESFINAVENIKITNPQKYTHTVMGGWLNKAEGVIYNNWSLGDFNENLNTIIYGQDFGFSTDPSTLIKVGIDKKNMKLYVKEMFVKQALSTQQLYDLNNSYAGKSLIVADNAENRLINELRYKGNNIIEAIKGAGSITAGISLMQDFEIIVDPSSKNIIAELNNYVWLDKENTTTPVDKYNHTLDAIRYAVYFNHIKSKGTAKRFSTF
ncbi:PBSX family phage terminase large subunit [Empedobacter sp. 225-1]|uniref:PBSX family phage terminase large subunit n=1 Tax=Empedobacter sp. 225-1 TaxID=2746725 RepID=UPI002576B98C|nr:PBSX family phage terminase large subunit [Empedobacter sp. 225-1]MDM1523832.1 PBSX family phage terminase large subunit [Empedobacter sp. 225-1]